MITFATQRSTHFNIPSQGIIQKKYGRIGFMQNKKHVPKARKMAAGGLGSAVTSAR